MIRFWNQAEVVLDKAHYAIRLDGQPMRLPGGPVLALKSHALAQAIAEEWQRAGRSKGGRMTPDDVPLTRIAGTAQERVALNPAASIEALVRYAEADLLCYRAKSPQALVARQEELWQPWLDWAAQTYMAPLVVARGVVHMAQPQQSLSHLRTALAAKPAFSLAGLGILVPATGSLVLGLAVADGALDPAEAHRLAALDELFQAENWGEDPEAAHRRSNVAGDIGTAARFIKLAQPNFV